uniref:SFRICE_028476 n=1 Tax=Spodoptera frugiperda TaxID=7108 RepID=A0A2H1VTC8_SPOFR
MVKRNPIVTDNEYWWGGHYPGEECNNKCGGMFYDGYLVNNDCEVKSFFICEHQGENHVGKNNMDQQSSALVPEVVTPEP